MRNRQTLLVLFTAAVCSLLSDVPAAEAQTTPPPNWDPAFSKVWMTLQGIGAHDYPQSDGLGWTPSDGLLPVFAFDHELFADGTKTATSAATVLTQISNASIELRQRMVQGQLVDRIEIRWFVFNGTDGAARHVYTVVLHDVQVVEVKDLMLTQFDPSYTEYGPRQQIKLLPTSVTWTYEANGSSTQYANTAK